MNNLDLTASFIIGGLVLLSIISFILFVHDASFSTSMQQVQQSNVVEIGQVIEYDIEKIGYRVPSNEKILDLAPHKILFLADLNNDGVIDSVHYFIRQVGPGLRLVRHTSLARTKDFAMDIVDFTIVGYDSAASVTSDKAKVRSLEIKLQLQQNHLLQTPKTRDVGAYWIRKFFPKNL